MKIWTAIHVEDGVITSESFKSEREADNAAFSWVDPEWAARGYSASHDAHGDWWGMIEVMGTNGAFLDFDVAVHCSDVDITSSDTPAKGGAA